MRKPHTIFNCIFKLFTLQIYTQFQIMSTYQFPSSTSPGYPSSLPCSTFIFLMSSSTSEIRINVSLYAVSSCPFNVCSSVSLFVISSLDSPSAAAWDARNNVSNNAAMYFHHGTLFISLILINVWLALYVISLFAPVF